MNEKITKVGNIVGRLILGSYADRIVETATKVSGIEKTLDEDIRPSLRSLSEKVIILWAEGGYAKSHSPITLNDDGVKVYNTINGESILTGLYPQLKKALDNKSPKSALDVENFSFDVLIAFKDDEIFKQVKDFVYNNPNFNNKKLSFTDCLFIISLKLRDKYLSEHQELLPK